MPKTFMVEVPDDFIYPETCTSFLNDVLEQDIEGAYHWRGMEVGTGIDCNLLMGRTGHFSRLTQDAWMLRIDPQKP